MVETVGGYDYKYITEIPEDLICSLCHFPFKNPVHVEECGHIYCKECFEQTKDHATKNALDFCCPLDRQNIDVTRVFKDKFNERKVLSLKVECRNLADGCSWTGELREAIDHEKQCNKNEKLVWERFEIELKNMSSCMKDLVLQVKCHEQQIEDKDKELEKQKKQSKQVWERLEIDLKNMSSCMKDLTLQVECNEQWLEYKDKEMENYSKQLEDQNMLMENQKKQLENCNKQIEDQNILMEKQKKRIENHIQSLNQPKEFVMPNKVIVIVLIVILSVLPSWVCSKQMEDQKKQMEDQKELIEILNMQIKNINKKINNENHDIKKQMESITDLIKQIENDLTQLIEYENKKLERKVDNQSNVSEKQKEEIKKLQQSLNSMTRPNTAVGGPNFAPVFTAFQWKVDLSKSKSGFFSASFYNIMNTMCFYLSSRVVDNKLRIALHRRQGKYDHPTNEIITTQNFELVVNVFGINGYTHQLKFSTYYKIFKFKANSIGIAHDEIKIDERLNKTYIFVSDFKIRRFISCVLFNFLR